MLTDLVVVKYSNSINYYTSLNLTKVDIAHGMPVMFVDQP
jgi:adenylosuccinate synthase